MTTDDEQWLAAGMADEARGLIRVEVMQISPGENLENKGENEQVDESGKDSSKLVHPETNKTERIQNEPVGENR